MIPARLRLGQCCRRNRRASPATPYLLWQVIQTALAVLVLRRKVGNMVLPAPPDGTPCGSWQDAHSTRESVPLP